MKTFKSKFLGTLYDRGFIHQCTDLDGLDAYTAGNRLLAYVGFDATADSLHVGNLVSLMMLRILRQCGGHPVALIGTGTTRIGDPSDKNAQRPLLSKDEIDTNSDGFYPTFAQLLGETVDIIDNGDWLNDLNLIDFLREVGPHFTINRMVGMDFVKSRLESGNPLSFLEFNYMLLQSYDFSELYKQYGVTLQMGGSDQWGNIVNGIDLGRRLHGAQLFGLTTPLITTASGGKMGKTEAGAVWLNPKRTSPYEYYQFWRNTEDGDVVRFLKLFTDLPMAQIDDLATMVAGVAPNPNYVKSVLAFEATSILHGQTAAEIARETAVAAFGGSSGSLEGLPSIRFAAGLKVYEAVIGFGFAKTKSEVRRLCEQGGVKINGSATTRRGGLDMLPITPDVELLEIHLVNGVIKVSVGPKRHGIVVESSEAV